MAIAFNTGNANTGTGDMLKATYDTDNDGKVDKAEAIDDGTYTATAANIADAVTKKHTQNTDTGTTSATFTANSVAVILEGDARLTNARTPASHNNTYHTETYITSAGVPTAGSTPTAEAFGDTQDGGTGTTWSKNDHRHAMPAAPT